MAVSQKGAAYANRSYIQSKDRLLAQSLDDLASKIQAVSTQTNASVSGSTPAPEAPVAINVTAKNGFGNVAITHKNAPAGTSYLIEYSPQPNFPESSTVRIDNGISKTAQPYLAGQGRLYFRAASTLYTTPNSPWIYYGGANPTPVSF